MQNTKDLILMDINSHIHRAYQGCLSRGENTPDKVCHNGRPNFMIAPAVRLIENELRDMKTKNDYIACIIDPTGKNFRHELYPDYKANRVDDGDDFRYMRECVLKILQLKGYFVIRKKGYEADDVIATIANKAYEVENLNIYISSRDKDLFDLINDRTIVYDGKEKIFYDREGCIKKKGVPPEKINDFLTMDGDKIDNITGIPNFGKKTIHSILNLYSLKEILENPELLNDEGIKMKGRQKAIDYITENKDFIKLMNELVTMKKDLELGVSLKHFIKKYEDTEAVKNAYKSLNIR